MKNSTEYMREYMRKRRQKEKQSRPDSWTDGRCKYATDAERDTARKQSFRKSFKKWKDANKKKIRAHWILSKAVSRGRIEKPDNCSKCGSTGIIHGHHADYSKPLDVVWLCPKCHKQIHNNDMAPTAGLGEETK